MDEMDNKGSKGKMGSKCTREDGEQAGAPNSAKFRGGCRGPAKIRQRGGCSNFFYFLRDKNFIF